MVKKIKNSVLKKLKEKEDKLFDIFDEISDVLETSENDELIQMGETFKEIVIDFLTENDTMTLNDIREFIEYSDEDSDIG